MSEIIHADIFFFIASIAAVVLLVVLSVAGYYLVLIVRDVRHITGRVRDASDGIVQDFENARAHMKHEASRLISFVSSMFSFFGRTGSSPRKTRTKKMKSKDVVE